MRKDIPLHQYPKDVQIATHMIGLNYKRPYCKSILALLNGKMRNEISDAISTYLPPEIPR